MVDPTTDDRRRLEGFDGLRACAAILVVAYHAGSVTHASLTGPMAPVVALLKAGVAIFFVISGFLLYLPYARAIRAGKPMPSWRQFTRRRFARIFPGYWTALTLLAAASLVTGVIGAQWWRFYGLAQIYDLHTLQQGLRVAWSLCVEITFYLALPIFAWGMARLTRASGPRATRIQLLAIGGVALCSLTLRGVLAQSILLPVPDHRLILATSLPGLVDWFALGIGLAVLRTQWESGVNAGRRLRSLANRPGRCWLLAALAYMIGVPAQQGEYFLPNYGVVAHTAIGLAAALFVLPAVAPNTGERERRSRPLALLRSRPLTWLGTISYGIYLWHVPFRDLVYRWVGAPRGILAFAAMFVLTLAGGVALGAASWYLVERPAQAWMRARRPRQGLGEGSTAVSASIPLS